MTLVVKIMDSSNVADSNNSKGFSLIELDTGDVLNFYRTKELLPKFNTAGLKYVVMDSDGVEEPAESITGRNFVTKEDIEIWRFLEKLSKDGKNIVHITPGLQVDGFHPILVQEALKKGQSIIDGRLTTPVPSLDHKAGIEKWWKEVVSPFLTVFPVSKALEAKKKVEENFHLFIQLAEIAKGEGLSSLINKGAEIPEGLSEMIDAIYDTSSMEERNSRAFLLTPDLEERLENQVFPAVTEILLRETSENNFNPRFSFTNERLRKSLDRRPLHPRLSITAPNGEVKLDMAVSGNVYVMNGRTTVAAYAYSIHG